MAPSVQLDFFAANDLNGDVIYTMDDEQTYFEQLELRIALYGLGGGHLITSRNIGDAMFDNGTFQPEVFVRAIIPAVSETKYQWGFFLDLRAQTLISADEKGGERFEIGGPGPLFYLSRAALGSVQNAPGSGLIRIDRENGVWRFQEALTIGRILNRLLAEDAARNPSALLDLTNDITPTDDSNGDPWTNEIPGEDPLELPIGQSFLEDLFELQDTEEDLVVTMDLGSVGTPLMKLQAWQSYGRNLVAASVTDFGPDVVHLKEAVNLEPDRFDASGASLRKCSHVLVHGLDGKYVIVPKPSWSDGDYVKYGYLDYGRTKNEATLERRGLRWLRKQDNGEQEFELPIKPGFDPDNGLYFPSYPSSDGHIWIGDMVSLTTGTDVLWSPLDYRNEPQRVTNIHLVLREAAETSTEEMAARSWDVIIGLNQERQSDNRPNTTQPKGSDGNPATNQLRLCHPATEAAGETEIAHFNANDPGGTSLPWTGLLPNQGGSGDGAEGTDYYYFKSNSPTGYATNNVFSIDEGAVLRVQGWVKDASASDSDGFRIGFFDTVPSGTPLDTTVLYDSTIDGDTGSTWTFFNVTCPPAPSGVGYWALGKMGATISFDEVRVFLAGEGPESASNVLAGTGSRAARCDHQHHWFSEDAPTVDDDETLGFAVGTVWFVVDDADAPTEASAAYILFDATDGAAVWGDFPGGTGGGGGHDITEDGGSPFASRANLDFRHGLDVTDDSGSDSTRIAVDESELSHASLANLTTGDPHPQYALDSDLAGYVPNTLPAAKGDLFAASANDTPAILSVGADGKHLVARSGETTGLKWEEEYAALTMVIGNGVNVIATGVKGYIRFPFDCELVSSTILADQSGAIKIDLWVDTYANYPPTDADTITGGNEPEITASGTTDEDTSLTSWDKSCAVGDVMGVNVDSCTSIKQVTLQLRVKKT